MIIKQIFEGEAICGPDMEEHSKAILLATLILLGIADSG